MRRLFILGILVALMVGMFAGESGASGELYTTQQLNEALDHTDVKSATLMIKTDDERYYTFMATDKTDGYWKRIG